MKYKEENIKEIADLIDCGHICFLNKKDGSFEYHPKEIDLFFDEENPWQDIIDRIENNLDDYLKIEQMDSNQSFQVMELFIEKVKSDELRGKLVNTLNRPKPFGNFKYLIDNSEYRQHWFDFKFDQNILWVKEQISGYQN